MESIKDSTNKDNNNNYIKELDKLLEMGFDKEKSKEMIIYTKGNIELAIEFLYNGIPNKIINNNDYQDDDNSLDANIGSDEGDDDDEHGEDYEDIIYLLQKLSIIVKIISEQKKKTIDDILKTLRKYNNKLYKFIKENEEEFKKCLSNPLVKEDYETFEKFKKGKDNLGHYNLDYKIFEDNYEKNNIINEIKNKNESLGNDIDLDYENDNYNNKNNLTEQENEVINKLKKLGNFSDEEVIQAYLLCDKNEEITASYIFENLNNIGKKNNNNINSINIINSKK